MATSKQLFVFVLATSLTGLGCASHKYVRRTVDPVSQKVDQVAAQTNQQGQTLEATRQQVDRDEQQINATREIAKGADARAGDAMNAANASGAKADQNNRAIAELRGAIANLDDFKPTSEVVIAFRFNRYSLTPEGQAELDKLAQSKGQWKRYFIAVEGFTDQIGGDAYNEALSRRRADKVTQYLVAKHDIPVYRIHQIGLGKDKLVDSGRGPNARAKNRRVEVTVYSADSGGPTTAQSAPGAS